MYSQLETEIKKIILAAMAAPPYPSGLPLERLHEYLLQQKSKLYQKLLGNSAQRLEQLLVKNVDTSELYLQCNEVRLYGKRVDLSSLYL